MKYIDTEKLITEIERRKKSVDECPFIEAEFGAEMRREGKTQTYNEILSIITSLQQEQPEVELDFQVFAKEMDAVFTLPASQTENTEDEPLNWEYAIARHFYELGLNARKK